MKQLRQWLSVVALLAGLSTVSGAEPERSTIIKLAVHDRDQAGQLRTQTIQLVPTQTAVVVVDMWDRHWCQTYTARVGNLIPRMNQTLDAARKLGLQVVFAPSDVVRVYEDTPQRKAMKTIPQHPESAKIGFNPPGPPGPTDFCECGPNRPCRSQGAWTRQHPDLRIADGDHLERYLRAGRPLVALRTSVVAFQTGKAPQPGHVVWERFDQQVLGCNYQGYNPKSRTTGCDVWATPATTEHPLLKDVTPKFHSPCWIYRQQPLADSVHVLLEGRWSDTESVEPVAWTNTYEGGRVFYTTLGHPGDFENPAFCQLLLNAIQWTLNR